MSEISYIVNIFLLTDMSLAYTKTEYNKRKGNIRMKDFSIVFQTSCGVLLVVFLVQGSIRLMKYKRYIQLYNGYIQIT